MKRGQLENQLAKTNPWWRSQTRRPWIEDDPNLSRAREAPYVYEPKPLDGIQSGGLYILFGPRRVGKSVELKRCVARLLEEDTAARRVVHAACDTWAKDDLAVFVEVLDSLSPSDDGPRYVFLDEITAVTGDWIAEIKWLRDHTSLGSDCVVLSGSSAERLEEARQELADRRGEITTPDRTLLPMGFRAFCTSTGVVLPEIPTIHPRDMLGRAAEEAIQELRVYLQDLLPAWERYLEVGGMPKSVSGWVDDREVPPAFQQAIWDVIHGDALKSDWAPSQTQRLLETLAQRLANPFNVNSAAHDLSVSNEMLNLRLKRLTDNYITWPCYQNSDDRPHLNAQRKHYFIDPLHSRLAAHRSAATQPPDLTLLTEQQLGITLRRVCETEAPGTWPDHDALMYFRSETRREIDFTGPWLGSVPYEGKYTEGHWKQQTATAMSSYGNCIMATRTVVERDGDRMAVPAPILGLLLDPTPLGAAARR